MYNLFIITFLVPVVVDSLTCYTCNHASRTGDCSNEIVCQPRERCFTLTSGNIGNVTFQLGCKAEQDCLAIGAHGSSGLVGKRAPGESRCHQCCAVDGCNKQLCSSYSNVTGHSSQECEDNPSINCGVLSASINICSDVDHAKTLCPKWCGLCEVGDGSWAEWSIWSSCSTSCGDGQMTRIRTCTNPPPTHGGHDCIGSSNQSITCHHRLPCPVHGGWGSWQMWSSCSVSCGVGIKHRQRNCTNPSPAHNGLPCWGDIHQYSLCEQTTCAVSGGWSPWQAWESCSVSCGVGMKRRQRKCNNPAPSNGGLSCFGDFHEYSLCQDASCEHAGVWSSWLPWGSCTGNYVCDTHGIKRRRRTCTNPSPTSGGLNCAGSEYDVSMCAPIDYCNVRLVKYDSSDWKRVELYHGGQWGDICFLHWNDKSATVVCRMFGYKSGIGRTTTTIGHGRVGFWPAPNCTGTENNVFDCKFLHWYLSECSPNSGNVLCST